MGTPSCSSLHLQGLPQRLAPNWSEWMNSISRGGFLLLLVLWLLIFLLLPLFSLLFLPFLLLLLFLFFKQSKKKSSHQSPKPHLYSNQIHLLGVYETLQCVKTCASAYLQENSLSVQMSCALSKGNRVGFISFYLCVWLCTHSWKDELLRSFQKKWMG